MKFIVFSILSLIFLTFAYAESSSPSKEEYGIRTLLLYPMNALVSDQLTRIRKMFGIHPDDSMGENGKSPLEILNEMRGKCFGFSYLK